jgi:imidazole glycerol-phosphate synthase subunit HisF
MFRPRIIPCLLLKGNGLVKTVKFENPNYIGDPINAVKIFNDLESDEVVFLDIEATKQNRMISLDFVKKVGEEAYMPFAVGGGIKSAEEIRNLLRNGAEKVVINSSALKNPLFVKEASDLFGKQSIIVSVDVLKKLEKYEIYGDFENRDFKKHIRKMEEMGAGEILINSVDNDGLMEGFDLELIEQVSKIVSIPVIACGGAGKLEHLSDAIKCGASAVAAGSIFVYSGSNKGILINYPDKDEIWEVFK